ncbi:hypothetical protein HKD37_07G020152 [Glycine soja]
MKLFIRVTMLLLLPPQSQLVSQTRLPLPFSTVKLKVKLKVVSEADAFPSFLPKEVHRIEDPFARSLAMRIHRLSVSVRFSENPIMSSCVKPLMQNMVNPVVLLHGFDSSCLEWRYTYSLLEEAGFETWAVDILGWDFSDLEKLPSSCDAFWKSHIKGAMILVGPNLDSAVASDFAVEKLVLIDASVYAEGTGNLATLPRAAAYAGIGRLHCLLPWWEDATVDFMTGGGYNVASQIKKRLHCELPDAIIRQISDCGHLPHVERPDSVVKFIVEFVQSKTKTGTECV